MSQSFIAKPSFIRFNILVVDDDSISLSIVSNMLKHWDYDVVTVRRPFDALSTIRIQRDIDLVVTDLHMPEMNGLELQKQISEEFSNLPVIVMSSDDRESVIMKCLASGVVFYMVKPVSPDVIKNVWQYAVKSKIGKSLLGIEEVGNIEGGSSADKISFGEIASASSANEEKQLKKNSKRKASKENNGTAPKKAKVVWTNSLHNRFLEAIRYITLEKAFPMKIVEFMNVPGLTRENVASHLQKYRLFLKRVAEKGAGFASKNTLRSNFASAHSSMMLREAQEYAQIKEKQQQMRSSLFQPGYGRGISALNITNFSSVGFPRVGASSSNSVSQLGLLGNQANFPQSLFANTANPIYQANQGTTFGTGSNDKGANSLSCGGLSAGFMNGTKSNQMSQQKSQTRPDPYNNNIGASSFKGFDISDWNTSVLENMGTISNKPNSNYTGIQLNDDGQLIGAGQTRLSGYDLINGTAGNEGVTSGLMGNETFHHLAPGQSSSSAFAGANEQENTSVLPPLSSEQQRGLGNNAQNDFTDFGIMNSNSDPVIGNTAQPEQFGEGIDFASLLFDESDYQFLFQQGGEGAVNPNFGNGPGTHQAELNLPINQSQNPDLSGTFAVWDNAPSPWNEPTLDQVFEEVVNSEFGNSNAHPLNDYYPSFDVNPNQEQGNQNDIISELNGPYPLENSPAENQGWDEKFINSLFRDLLY